MNRHDRLKPLTLAVIMFVAVAGATAVVNAQTYKLDWLSINSGGEIVQTSDNYGAEMTAAQSVAGYCESEGYRAYLGFWYPLLGSAVAVQQVESPTLPTAFSLKQNYPNPFNPATTIEFAIPRSGLVRLEIYNMLGQLVAVVVNEQLPAGTYRAAWDGCDLWGSQAASGVYLYRLEADNFVMTRKMVLLK
jgi:roadblock/LC7 domain-containing protein